MSWRATKRGGSVGVGPRPTRARDGAGMRAGSMDHARSGSEVSAEPTSHEGGVRQPAVEVGEIDAPHVEALVAMKRGRWLALDPGKNDGWARAAEVRDREEETYDLDEHGRTVSIERRVDSGEEATTSDNESARDDDCLMQLYDVDIRGTHPLPGSLALPRTPPSAMAKDGEISAVSARACASEGSALRFTLQLTDIHFEVGALETVEGTMALYDLQKRTKISENFHFSWPTAKQNTLAAFTIPGEALSPHIRLIVHLTHLAADEGGIEDKVYTYKDVRKAKVHAEKERQRVLGMEALRQQENQKQQGRPTTSVHSSEGGAQLAAHEVENSNVSKRRNTLAWAVLPAFENATMPSASSLLSETKCDAFYRVKEAYSENTLLEAALSSGVSHSLKSHKPIRCTMVCRLSPLDLPVPGADKSDFKLPNNLVYVRELISLSSSSSRSAVAWETAWGGAIDDGVARDLYVYITGIDIGKRQDLRVRVQLRDDDLDIDGHGLLAFPSPCGRGLCRESWTALSRLRSKGGVFYHEARVRLPVRLNPSHHLVLSIFGAQSASSGIFSSAPGEEELLGHSVVNLCSQAETLAPEIANAASVTGSDVSLVAVRELLPKYLQTNVRAHMPYWEERKEVVHVRFRLISSMHTGDSHVGALFAASASWCENQTPDTEDRLRIAVSELSLANDEALLQHLPAILNLLMSLTLRVSESDASVDQREDQLSSRLSKNSFRGDEEDDMASLASAGMSDDFAGSIDFNANASKHSSIVSTMSKNERVDETQDIGTLAFHTLVRVVATIQRINPGPPPSSKGVVSHSPPLEAYITLAFGALERSASKYLTMLSTLGASKHSVPMHTILARRYASVLATTRESYVPYEEALSMSWFFMGMIHRALALERAQSPSDTTSVEHDEVPLKQVVDTLSNEVKTRGERSAPSFAELEQARNLNCGLASFITKIFSIPGMKRSAEAARTNNMLGRAGPLSPLATRLAAAHVTTLGEGNNVHMALLREFLDTIYASPVILDIITASAVYEGKNGWTNDTRNNPGDALVDALTEAIRLNLSTASAHNESNSRAECAMRIVAATLARHAWDHAWQSSGARKSIAAAYAPLLRLLISHFDAIEVLPLVARRDAFVSILTLARDSDSNKLWTWLTEEAARMKSFVGILSMTAVDFALEKDENNTWSPTGPMLSNATSLSVHDRQVAAGQLNTRVYTSVLRLIREWHARGSLKSNWGVIGAAARAMGISRTKSGAENSMVISSTKSSSSSPATLAFEDGSEDTSVAVDGEMEHFNALEGVLGVMLAILSRPQSASSWKASAPILNSLLNEHGKILMSALRPVTAGSAEEEFPPKPADLPGVSPYSFLQGAAIAVFKAAARPSPVRELAVASLRTMLEAAVHNLSAAEPLCPTLVYGMHAAFFPLQPISCTESLSNSLKALRAGNEVSPAGWNNSVKKTLSTLDLAESCIRKLAMAILNPRTTLDLAYAVERESELSQALNSSPAAHVKVLQSLSHRLSTAEHWVEAAEASTAAAIVAMQAFAVAAPSLCVWFDHDIDALRNSFFALPDGAAPKPTIANVRCGTEEIGESQILNHLSRAVELFTRGGHIEAALRVNETAQIAWQTHRQFDSLMGSHSMMSDLYRRLDIASAVGDVKRYKWDLEGKAPPEPATFWRIRLFGDTWGELKDCEWVYRESQERTLGDMNRKIVEQLSQYLPPNTPVRTVSTNVEPTVVEGTAAVQITAVQPDMELLRRAAIGGGVGGTGFAQCDTFMFDTPVLFSEEGELTQQNGPIIASLRYQGRRRTKIMVAHPFPSAIPRQQIVETVAEEINPCQSAILMLEEQTLALLTAANARRPQAELLQRLLQGSLAAGVNGGVPSLINSFFDITPDEDSEIPNGVTHASSVTPERITVQDSPTPRLSTPRIGMHKRGLSENAVPMGAGIPLDTPTTASPSPHVKAPPPSPASVATSVPTPMSVEASTLSPSTPAPPLSRSDGLELVRSLWKLYEACSDALETHKSLSQPAHLDQLFRNALLDLKASIELVERDLDV